MKEIKEIDKNRKAKFERLLSEFVNNRIDADAVLERSYIYKNILGLAEQYLAHAKRDIMSFKSLEDIDTRLGVHVKFLLDFNKTFSHVSKCLNCVQRGRFKPLVQQKKGIYFGRKMDVAITELGYTIDFPGERVKLFCTKRIVNDIKFNL